MQLKRHELRANKKTNKLKPTTKLIQGSEFGVNVKQWLIFLNKKLFKNYQACKITSTAKNVRFSKVHFMVRIVRVSAHLGFILIGILLYKSVNKIASILSYIASRAANSIEFYSSSSYFSKSEFSNIIFTSSSSSSTKISFFEFKFEFRQVNIQNRDNFFTAGAHGNKKDKNMDRSGMNK